jgi:hypothetical protein
MAGIVHTARFVVSGESLVCALPEDVDGALIMEALGIPVFDDGYEVARLTVRELVGWLHAADGWMMTLDAIDEELSSLGFWLDSAAERLDLELSPSDCRSSGAVFYQ